MSSPENLTPIGARYDARMDDEDLGRLFHARRGHFVFESGHHGELWLEIERLVVRPEVVAPLAREVAGGLRAYDVEVVGGPLVEGAFLAMMVAAELGARFVYTERFVEGQGLFPVRYRLPAALREEVAGRRVAIVDGVINAGSAVGGTYDNLAGTCRLVALAALLVLGDAADALAASRGLPLLALARRPSVLWAPPDCPLCARGAPLDA
jgi:orotate phosphoribosyltransferase